ncbi:MAG: alpha-glucosidase [Hespellia sp.]|nr:alpha-glucosidase [Hespellia sp.]
MGESSCWWRKSVVYEIYVRSFKDSNGDGVGDLNGITEKLDYLQNLGVDVLWLTPIYESPGDDNGYDISDYCSIMKSFGTMKDFEHLLNEAHRRKIKIVMDLVVNHTSDEHSWFVESRKNRDNSYRDYYIWRDGKEGNMPPNNWTSCFLGSAWQYDAQTEQYYLHMFSKKQPDLNWDYEPVRKEVYKMMRWWLDKGIDGFRMDVISLISKDSRMLCEDSNIKGHTVCANGPRVHEYLQEMHREVLSNYDIMTVGETPAVTVREACQYAANQQSELSMVFQFELMDVDGGESGKWNDKKYQLQDVKAVLRKWQEGLYGQAWGSLFWNNHDQPRVVSRFGDTSTKEYWNKSAKMLATALYLLQGTPYIYQGEELGMTNLDFQSIDEFRDIESLNAYQEYVEKEKSISSEDMMRYVRKSSRDNARSPMQWDDSENAGFSAAEPWIGVHSNYQWLNAKQQMEDKDSILHYYQKLIRILRENNIVCDGKFQEFMEDSPALYCYRRFTQEGEIVVCCNFTKEEQAWDERVVPEGADILIGNYEKHQRGVMNAYEAIVYQR